MSDLRSRVSRTALKYTCIFTGLFLLASCFLFSMSCSGGKHNVNGLTSHVGSSGDLSGSNISAKTDSTPKPIESRSLSIESAIEEVKDYEPPANIVQTGKIDPEVFVKLNV